MNKRVLRSRWKEVYSGGMTSSAKYLDTIWLVICSIIISTIIQVALCQDPCDSPTDLSDPRRSIDYEEVDGTLLCDQYKIVEGTWYTFETYTGGKMPEECPPVYQCGTTAPIWFDGSHPEDSEIHDAVVCVNYGDCCFESYNIKVKRCDDDKYVYQLVNPSGCDIAYCAGSGLPCSNGTLWVEDTSSCEDAHPVMTDDPVLVGPVAPDDYYRGTFSFFCDIAYPQADTAARFDVYWYLDGEEDEDLRKVGMQNLSIAIDETELTGHMGKTLSCGARIYWAGHADKASTIRQSSNAYWMGIQAPAITSISETAGDDSEITFISTVPVTCGCCLNSGRTIFFKRPEQCSFAFRVNSMGDAKDLTQTCSVVFTPGSTTSSLKVRAIRTGQVRTSQVALINFFPYDILQNPVWDGYMLPPVQVQLKNDIKSGTCASTGDPHITTLDGQYYHLYQPGNFLMVKSSSNRLFEVHARLKLCGSTNTVSCNCGVIVREGNVLIGVDNCQNNFRTFKKLLTGTKQYHGSLSVDRTGRQFTIAMPSGAKVVAHASSWYMNVYIYLPGEDKYQIEGLCGSWDDERSNDFKLRNSATVAPGGYNSVPRAFTDSYRLPLGESFFDGDPECEVLEDQPRLNNCGCDEASNEIICDAASDALFDLVLTDTCNSKRRKRTTDLFQELFPDFGEVEEDPEIGDIVWPTPSGITEEMATQQCRSVIEQSAVYEQCKELGGAEELISACVEDMKVTDEFIVDDALLDVFESGCLEAAKLNVTTGNDTGETTQEELLVEEIEGQICPRQCSGNGSCIDGVCHCYTDFIGEDCSIQKGVAPIVQSVEKNGLCDLASSMCSGIKISGDTFISGTVCQVVDVTIDEDGTVNTDHGSTRITESMLLSNTKVLCGLPEITGKTSATFKLSVSHDGEVFSEEKLVTVWDSTCKECSDTGNCYLKSGTCELAGECYTGDICTACDEALDIGNPKRSTVYEIKGNDIYICDAQRILEGYWYKFDQYTGNMIPEHCVTTFHCGTHGTIWFNGTHPTVDNPISDGIACANLDDNDCCSWNASVNVRYCAKENAQDFFAYQLVPPPQCEMAYCSGDIMPCEDHEEWNEENEECTDLDECEMDACVHGSCTDGINQFTCHCDEGYTGVLCDSEINLCDDDPCVNGACVKGFNSYTCLCNDGYTGDNCETDIDECESNPCENNGECVNQKNQFACNCQSGYMGELCDEGLWEPWQQWSGCSLSCGYGYQNRIRQCMVESELCRGENMEYDVCLEEECADDGVTPLPEEDETDILVTKDTIDELLDNEEEFKEMIATHINFYCSGHVEECCTSMHLEFTTNGITILVSSSNILLTPEGLSSNGMEMRLTVVVSIEPDKASDYCGSDTTESLLLGDDVVAVVISSNVDEIESATGVVITDVEKQTQVSATTTVKTDSDSASSNLTLIVPLVVVGVLALAVVVIVVVVCIKKDGRPERTQSRISVASNKTLHSLNAVKPTYPDMNMTIGNHYETLGNSQPPQYYDYARLRPKTGVQRHGLLPPLQT